MQQETVYGLVVVGFLASSAIYNEKRSRRIVAVLSKAVSRTQYLLGFVVGAICFAAAYFASVAITAIWLMHDPQFAPVAAAAWYAQVLVASVWICSAALLFATFLHPLLAAALTGVCAFAPLAFSYRTVFLSPVTILIERLAATPAQITWTAMSIAAVESVIFVAAAGIIFARRDVTLSIE